MAKSGGGVQIEKYCKDTQLIDFKRLTYTHADDSRTLVVRGEGDVTVIGMHIHEAPVGENGGIRIRSGLEFGGDPVIAMGGAARIWRQVEIVDSGGLASVGRLVDNPTGFYLNLHSESSRRGLLRGQLQLFNADRLARMISEAQSQTAAVAEQQEFNSTILRRVAFRLGVLRRGE